MLLLCWGHCSCITVVVGGVKCEAQGKPSIFLKLSVSMPLVESKEGFELKLILGIDGVQGH